MSKVYKRDQLSKEDLKKLLAKFKSDLTEIQSLRALLEKREREFNDRFNPIIEKAVGKSNGTLLDIFNAGFELGDQ